MQNRRDRTIRLDRRVDRKVVGGILSADVQDPERATEDVSERRRVAICSPRVGTSAAGGARRREASMASTLIGKQAVVIGAGMAGLTAAGALADRFDQVVVLERDTLPSEPTYRAGTPQARHVHALLLSGQRALSELFPGFEQDLT